MLFTNIYGTFEAVFQHKETTSFCFKTSNQATVFKPPFLSPSDQRYPKPRLRFPTPQLSNLSGALTDIFNPNPISNGNSYPDSANEPSSATGPVPSSDA